MDELLKAVETILKRTRAEANRHLKPLSLTDTQARLLLSVTVEDPVTTDESKRHGLQTAGSTTRILDRLEAKGFVRRKRSTSDRRVVHIEVTGQGRQVAKEATTVLSRVESGLLASFTPEEREQLEQLLRKIEASSKHVMAEDGLG